MAFTRKSLAVQLSQFSFQVWEENWDSATLPDQIISQARSLREQLNGTGRPDLLAFHEKVFPWLAGYATGEVPTIEQTFDEMSDEDLDRWFLAVRSTNSHLFPEQLPEPVTLTMGDGSNITVHSARKPSVLRRVFQQDLLLDRFLVDHPDRIDEFPKRSIFSKMAACSTGDIPTFEEVVETWPMAEVNRWYVEVNKMNSFLFMNREEIDRLSQEETEEDLAKKNSQQERS